MLGSLTVVWTLAALTAILALIIFRFRVRLSIPMRVAAGITLALLLGLTTLGFTGPLSYSSCTPVRGACPTAIGGTGFICSNEGSVCADGPDDAEDYRCKTIKSGMWSCKCDCCDNK